MQEITFEIDAQRAGRANGFLGGLTVERYTFTGAEIPAGTRLAILTRAGTLIAAAEIAEGNAAEVDTNTQEVADLLRYQPLGTCETVYIALGDADNILAIIPATMRKNWIDDEATHPPVPANRYPTKTELGQWLARFDERATATAAAQSAAESAATSANNSATAAQDAATDAGLSAKVANDSATEADEYKRSAETSQSKAEAAQRAAEAAASAASSSAAESKDATTAASNNAAAAQTAATTAQNAANAANNSATAADEHNRAAQSAAEAARSSENAASDSAATASSHATTAQNAANAANNSANAAKQSETAAAESSTSASASATAANASENAASSSAAAAAKSAAAAASSASAAKQSETDLAEAVATAEGLDERLGSLEGGLGVYKDSTGKVVYFTRVGEETTSTLTVVNRVPFARKIVHVNHTITGRFSVTDECAMLECFDYAKNKRYVCISDIKANRTYVYLIGFGGYGNNSLTHVLTVYESYGTELTLFSGAICIHNGFLFHRYNRNSVRVVELATGSVCSTLYIGSITHYLLIWYNPRSRHICALLNGVIHVMTFDAEAKSLAYALDEAGAEKKIDVGDFLINVCKSPNKVTYGMLLWAIRDRVFILAREGFTNAGRLLVQVTDDDDGLEPCYEWDVEYATGEDGITRPVFETQPEAWTDADGNTHTIQNYVRNTRYDNILIPKMTRGREMWFLRYAEYDGAPKGTWSANPVFYCSAYNLATTNEASGSQRTISYQNVMIMTDGVVRWAMLSDGKFVREEAFNRWDHGTFVYENKQDDLERGADGVYKLTDVRKGSARTWSGWLPSYGQCIASVGGQQGDVISGGVFDSKIKTTMLVTLTEEQSGTALSRLGMVDCAGRDGAKMTILPFTATFGNYPGLSYNFVWASHPGIPIGFFGSPLWLTSFKETYGGKI